MVDSAQVEAVVQPQDEVDLTDDQIQQLLLEAEGRLRGPNALATQEDAAALRIPKLTAASALEPYVRQSGDIATADSSQLIDSKQKELSNTLRSLDAKKSGKENPTAGPGWFNLPKTNLTPELKRDLQLLRMRSVLDPKRHYKKESGKAQAPEFSQVGTIIQGPTEFFSGRINKRDRKKTFVEEVMATERESGRFANKYKDIQRSKKSGKKAYYNNLRSQRNQKNK
ncbi:Fcf2 pre-rRNA processing [Penicillium capsulatum]|uniref:Fcf2 pre-rRNA processing n=1 Tax=Penicillium capsulatum TaxID=69766 RepID=A0A9W9LX31_9EURO|nr:Fcf2 pre-rRNA processing [Penicillium capsulatum]KAJ6121853.1 Fcf2 pre-rRNA processing [Penicillium capsulatum]